LTTPKRGEKIMNNSGGQNLNNLKQRGFEVCLAVYRVTKLFPRGEILVSQLCEAASKIAVALAQENIYDTILNIEAVKIYLEIAKIQNWVKPVNFDLLIRAYCELFDAVSKLETEGDPDRKKITDTPPPLKIFKEQVLEKKHLDDEKIRVQKRHEQIAQYLKENSPAKTSEIVNFLGNVVDRTVRIDLNTLIDNGIVKKSGVNKTARYFIEAK